VCVCVYYREGCNDKQAKTSFINGIVTTARRESYEDK
jgi:hypothetical protein